eukprot:310305-Hanusia_phi.AAC.1
MTQSGYDKDVPTSTFTSPLRMKTAASNKDQKCQKQMVSTIVNIMLPATSLSSCRTQGQRSIANSGKHLLGVKPSMSSLSKRPEKPSNSFLNSHFSYSFQDEKAEESWKQPRKQI